MTGRSLLASRRAFAWQLVLAGAAGLGLACAAPSQTRDDDVRTGTADQAPTPIVVIDHLVPRRDFVGPQPDRFTWTAAAGADRYAIGVWNEADTLVWRGDAITGTSIDRPAGLAFEPGTYFWSVSGQREGREIARSGQSAFVVE